MGETTVGTVTEDPKGELAGGDPKQAVLVCAGPEGKVGGNQDLGLHPGI